MTTAGDHRPIIRLAGDRHRRVASGSPWVYSNEIDPISKSAAMEPGQLVGLVTSDNRPLGVASFHPHALIAARLYDADPYRLIDVDFFVQRLEKALRLRRRIYDGACFRLVNAEADGLPGLIVDLFGDAVVVQTNIAGMERLRPQIIAALQLVLAPRVIYSANDGGLRAAEGLAAEIGVLAGVADGSAIVAVEYDGWFACDPLGGQKTGWFYDQRENRRAVARFARDRSVLDLCCYRGGFAIQAALAGAARVLGIDRSEAALAGARENAARNRVADRCQFERAELFAWMDAHTERHDVVICDPPAFAKVRREQGVAVKGYEKLARLAACLVAPEGILFIASCSHVVGEVEFAAAIRRGLHRAGRSGRILSRWGAAPDHPTHPFLPETAYLKSVLIELN